MARLEAYRCCTCYNEVEEIFNDTDERPEELDYRCEKCGGILRKFAFKFNQHRSYVMDRGI
jgi:DNA-directed RNA polymerase subunit RPC12/RpoP